MDENDDVYSRVLGFLSDTAPQLARELGELTDADIMSLRPAIPDFELHRLLGSGGFGDVWLAQNHLDQQFYALKTLREGREVELEAIRHYKQRIGDSPNLVPIGHVGEANGVYYYVMPLADDAMKSPNVKGIEDYEPLTLAELLRREGPLPPARVIGLAEDVLNGLKAIHSAGLIHRDVKPENVVMLNGVWCLSDPGLLTRKGDKTSIAGTAQFFEKHQPSNDVSADLFALGVTLDHATDRRMKDPLADLVIRAIERTNSENHETRFQSAEEMSQFISTRQQPTSPSIRKWFIAALAVAACVAATFLIARSRDKQTTGIDRTAPSDVEPDMVSIPDQERPRLNDFAIQLFKGGRIGTTQFNASTIDHFRVEVETTAPTRLALVAFDTDGSVSRDLRKWTTEKISNAGFPLSKMGEGVLGYMAGNPGVQALALFSADNAMDPSTWDDELSKVAWQKHRWDKQLFWSVENNRADYKPKNRGVIELEREPAELTELYEQLNNIPNVNLEYLCMFAVEPSLSGNEFRSHVQQIKNRVSELKAHGNNTALERLLREEIEQYRESPSREHVEYVTDLFPDFINHFRREQRYSDAWDACWYFRSVTSSRRPTITSVQACLLSAQVLNEQGRYSESVQFASKACRHIRRLAAPTDNLHVESHTTYAGILIDQGQAELALEATGDLLKHFPSCDASNPSSISIRLSHIAGLIQLERLEKAQEMFDEVETTLGANTETSAESSTLVSKLSADLAMANGDFDSARVTLSSLDTEQLCSPLELNQLGTCHFANGDYKAAIEVWERSAETTESNFRRDSDVFGNSMSYDDISPRNLLAAAELALKRPVAAFRHLEANRAFGLRVALSKKQNLAMEPMQATEIQSLLRNDEAIMGWFSTNFGTKQIADQHWCYVLRSSGHPRFFQVSQIGGESSRMLFKKMATGDGKPRDVRRQCRELYETVVSPAEPALKATRDLPVVQKLIAISTGRFASQRLLAILDASEKFDMATHTAPSASIWAELTRKRQTDPRFKKALVIANPSGDLAGASAIASRIRSQFEEATVLTGAEITESQVQRIAMSDEMESYDFVSFSGHVVYSDQAFLTSLDFRTPKQRALKYSASDYSDDMLPAAQIMHTWNLDANLVLLAGCASDLGARTGTDGHLGLTPSFLTAGAKCVLLSHWPVRDGTTTLLVQRFIDNLTGNSPSKKKLNTTEALAEAKRWLRTLPPEEAAKLLTEFDVSDVDRGSVTTRVIPSEPSEPPFAHPFYWAGFSLSGGS